MECLNEPLRRLQAFREADLALSSGKGPVLLCQTAESQKVHIMKQAGKGKTRLIVSYDEIRARSLLEDFRFFSKDVVFFPEKDFLFYQADGKNRTIVTERIKVFRKLYEFWNADVREDKELTVVTSIAALMNITAPKEYFFENVITIKEGDTVDPQALSARLISLGFKHVGLVEEPGQFALHGGIIDVFDLTEENPYRIELWDNEVDTIRYFSLSDQLSTERKEKISIFPASEVFLSQKRLLEGMSLIEKEYKKAKEALSGKENSLSALASLQTLFNDAKEEAEILNFDGTLERFMPYFYKDAGNLLDYFKEPPLIFVEEPDRTQSTGKADEDEFMESFKNRLEKGMALPTQAKILLPVKKTMALLETGRTMCFTSFDSRINAMNIRETYYMEVQPMVSFMGNYQGLITELKRYSRLGYSTVLLCPSKTRAGRTAEELRENGLKAFYEDDTDRIVKPGEIMLVFGALRKGYIYPGIKFILLTESDIFGQVKKKKRVTRKQDVNSQKIKSFAELSPGDYVVHENSGIGIYKGIKNIQVDGISRDYITINYGDSGNLYIPVTNLDVVQKYAGKDGAVPKINRLDTPDWRKTKTRVKAAVEEIAKDLVMLYAVRQNMRGFVYSEDNEWQKEFEELFPFEETVDQLEAINDVKNDMESGKIMDRLICGDVGFGKTEVALRAAFKTVQDGKQVAYMVPTTILAGQHYNTFMTRMQSYPINIELLSRFRSNTQQEKTVKGLKTGQVDIVIGTHRILSKDVEFKNLGLLIIDEEQRFGVRHKEKIKQMRKNVNVLTLTATPIPRTLHMSMIGVRDMSILTEPPTDRKPIQTYVMEYSEELVREAISRELSRNGQVYYVYNRVANISELALSIQKLVPEAVVDFAHGQMSERELERKMQAFVDGDIDVLVSTTIIETGLDIPNVNTIIIHDADRYGLSQLYQLRGRVGRSQRQAFAFIMYQRNHSMSENAEKRLEAIRQFTELGSGIKIARQDLELRGAGSILGDSQSGHMMEVGYELYCKMLAEAIKKTQGIGTDNEETDTFFDIKVDAYIPASYILNEALRLEIYKRISFIDDLEDCEKITDELVDRFGEPPECVIKLIKTAYLRSIAKKLYLSSVKGNRMEMKFVFSQNAKIDPAALMKLIKEMNGQLAFVQAKEPGVIWKQQNIKAVSKPVLETLEELLLKMKEYLT